MIVVHATFPIDPSRREEALDLARDVVAASTEEPGVVDYRAAVDVEDENVLRFVERYEDAAAVEVHEESEHFRAFAASLPDVLAGEPEATRFAVDSATDVEF
ncbi:quinol monooxygenase YgiN [Halarchaeum rubridurum]|uniref:Antibiotic biosynthesis monooxygenase n=1 Tax=Halarchaeum rubridurum TaxID=489911 RepID=A0A830FPT8_9EURY|nr:putative quinol monooxygenase [Halarchaeum rubridurum]MBP1953171.1 quinol monooxygenase YgiN [Halarchaeum rubridurum]GGM67270.1 antibiotic biosynthesis monooxygenase [Halarchaeum rubridurum]